MRDRHAGAEQDRFDHCIDAFLGRRRIYTPQPTFLHFPLLPAREFYPRTEFTWLEQLETATAAIREALARVLAEDAASLEPYIAYPQGVPLDQWRELNHSRRWSVFYLWRDGKPVEDHLQRCREVLRRFIAAGREPLIVNSTPLLLGAALLLASTTNAEPVDAVAPALRACASVKKNSERLACYDQAIERLSSDAAAPNSASAPAIEREELTSVSARVTALRHDSNGALVIDLDNGQQWRQTNGSSSPLLEVGHEVTIARATLNSFRMSTPSGPRAEGEARAVSVAA